MNRAWITEPGVYDIPSETYHRDPVKGRSLSYSGSKRLLISPSHFREYRDNGGPNRESLDLGKAAHKKVLGVGEDVVVVNAEDWKAKRAQDARKAAYARGAVPILIKQARQVARMAIKLRRHPLASRLLNPEHVIFEQTIVWRDPVTGVWCRLMSDAIRAIDSNGIRYVLDYKTRAGSGLAGLGREVFTYGYFAQGAWYLDGIRAMEGLGLLPRAEHNVFVLIFQEKDAPHEVACVDLHPEDIAAGDAQNRDMRRLYAECQAADRWPGPAEDEFVHARMPDWAHYQLDDAAAARAAAREDAAA